MSYAPHPWDALPASPPAPGRDYEDALDPLPVADALHAAELIRDADDLDDQALELESEADDHRSDARKLLEAIREKSPALADAIENDPQAITDEASVRRAAHPGPVGTPLALR